MTRKNAIILGALFIIILAGVSIYYLTRQPDAVISTATIEDIHIPALGGIPSIENQQLLDNHMGQDKDGNANGTLKYRVDKFDKSIDEAAKFYINNTDKEKWQVDEVKQSLKTTRQLTYKPKSKDLKSQIVVTLFKSKDKLFITILSYIQ